MEALGCLGFQTSPNRRSNIFGERNSCNNKGFSLTLSSKEKYLSFCNRYAIKCNRYKDEHWMEFASLIWSYTACTSQTPHHPWWKNAVAFESMVILVLQPVPGHVGKWHFRCISMLHAQIVQEKQVSTHQVTILKDTKAIWVNYNVALTWIKTIWGYLKTKIIPSDSHDLQAFPAIPGDVGHPGSPGRFTFSRTTRRVRDGRWNFVGHQRCPLVIGPGIVKHVVGICRMHDISVTMKNR